MATAPGWDSAGATVGLWKLNFKINTEHRGFNLGFHIAEKNEADAKAAGIKIAKHLKGVLPTSAAIVFATVSKDNAVKDSRFIRDALGEGQFILAGPVNTTYDFSQTSLLVRLEHAGGSLVPMKLGPLPDTVVTDEAIVDALDDVADFSGPEPADPAVFTVWADNYKSLMQVIIMRTAFVKADHLPGLAYTWFAWTSAFPIRIARKKGGRVFP